MAILLGISVTTEHSVVPHGIAVIDLVKSLAWLRLNFPCMSNTWTSDERTESIVTDFSVCFLSLHWQFKEFVLDYNADKFHGVLESEGTVSSHPRDCFDSLLQFFNCVPNSQQEEMFLYTSCSEKPHYSQNCHFDSDLFCFISAAKSRNWLLLNLPSLLLLFLFLVIFVESEESNRN